MPSDLNDQTLQSSGSAKYFNYISLGGLEENDDIIVEESMSLGRVLEHTQDEIASRLTGLGDEARAFIKSLPTFLCSELILGEEAAIIVKYGRINSLYKSGKDGKELRFEFEVIKNFGMVKLEYKQDAAVMFNARGGQPYRTHWAVMNGDANSVLENIGKALSESGEMVPDEILEGSERDDTNLDLPGARSFDAADSVESFLKLVFGQIEEGKSRSNDGEEIEYFFRGHDDTGFLLAPSVMRDSGSGSPMFLTKEEQMNKELLIAHYDEFQNDQYCFDQLVRMQHYGIPTRLLDLSANPLIALYFACEMAEKAQGQVIILGVKRGTIKYYDSDTVSCLANLSKLTIEQKDAINVSLDREDFNRSDAVNELLLHISAEKSYFKPNIDPRHIESILCVKAKRNNERIRSQQGAFLLFGHGAKMPEEGNEDIEVRRININDKRKILAQLSNININATTVYPSISGSAQHIKITHMNNGNR